MKKIIKLFTLFVTIFMLSFLIACKNTNNTEIDQKEVIYNLAVESGYTGTYEEWLESIKGDYIELSVNSTHIVWKYTDEVEWKPLIKIFDIKINETK